jgi:hypothetical protein
MKLIAGPFLTLALIAGAALLVRLGLALHALR